MQFGATDIAIPFEALGGDPTFFDPAWRAKVADLVASGYNKKNLPKLLLDKVVLKHAEFLKAFKSPGSLEEVYSKYKFNGLCMNWAAETNGSKTKHYLQALLLTDQPISVIAEDLQLDEQVVKLYCDLYFACRKSETEYKMALPLETRLSFAFGEMAHDASQLPTFISWRVMAVRNGYSALVHSWGIEKFAHGKLDESMDAIDRNMGLVNVNIEQQLRAGTVGFRSLVEYMNSWQGYRKLQEGIEGRDGTDSPLYSQLGLIFQSIAPKLIADAISEDEKKAEIKAGKKKLLAEKNIESHNSDNENRRSVSAEFNKIKREKFKLIDSTTGSAS